MTFHWEFSGVRIDHIVPDRIGHVRRTAGITADLGAGGPVDRLVLPGKPPPNRDGAGW